MNSERTKSNVNSLQRDIGCKRVCSGVTRSLDPRARKVVIAKTQNTQLRPYWHFVPLRIHSLCVSDILNRLDVKEPATVATGCGWWACRLPNEALLIPQSGNSVTSTSMLPSSKGTQRHVPTKPTFLHSQSQHVISIKLRAR